MKRRWTPFFCMLILTGMHLCVLVCPAKAISSGGTRIGKAAKTR